MICRCSAKASSGNGVPLFCPAGWRGEATATSSWLPASRNDSRSSIPGRSKTSANCTLPSCSRRMASVWVAERTSISRLGNSWARISSGWLQRPVCSSGAMAMVRRFSRPLCSCRAWASSRLSWQITCLACGSSARAALVGKALRVARSNSTRSSSASSWAMAMLTAEGTRPSLRAAAENEPASSTARKIARESLVKAMSANLKRRPESMNTRRPGLQPLTGLRRAPDQCCRQSSPRSPGWCTSAV
ncbi:hypothetical protein D3C81_1265370 [compost metagenome]